MIQPFVFGDKHMFKSVFAKYISAFMLINVISIVLSVSIITLLVRDYDNDDKNRTLSNVAESTAEFVSESYELSSAEDFREYVGQNYERLMRVLQAIVINIDNINITVSDSTSDILLVYDSSSERQYEKTEMNLGHLPEDLTENIGEGPLSGNGTLDGFFTEKRSYYATGITTSDGKITGIVLVYATSHAMDALLESMIKTIIMSSLWLMLAMLVAVYFISEKLISPLRSMSKAANEFGQGHFDVRVNVRGDDEVSQLAESFNSMADSMQRSEESRRLFLANVSHDLRTPMTTITGFIQSIQEGAIPQDKVPHYLDVISSEVKRLSRLVSSLMDITKIQAGERKFNKAPFDICEMAREIIISNEQRLEEKKLDVSFEVDEDNIYVNSDRDAVYQVMYNLCDNAIKFSREGGAYRIEIRVSENRVTFSIYNEGAGISEEDLPYIFDRFYKSDRSRGLDKTGVGLGLYISRTIMEQLGEKIWAESVAGEWCKFSFTMPKTASHRGHEDRKGIKSRR